MAGVKSQGEHVLFSAEAESFIKDLIPIRVEMIGSERWSSQREKIEKLMMQSVANATEQSDDFITSLLVSYDKSPLVQTHHMAMNCSTRLDFLFNLKVIVFELICHDLWKTNVFPLLFKQSVVPTTGFPTYLVLYHEATIVSLLELVLFYKESCEELNELAIDLIDYCYRNLNELVGHDYQQDDYEGKCSSDETPETITKDLLHQAQSLAWGIQIKCLSIIHYISDHLKVLPLSVSSRLLNICDFPCLLVRVLEMNPWSKTNKSGKLMKFENGNWQEINQCDSLKVTKVQAQVWLTLYRLLMDNECQSKYEFTPHRKQYLLKLQGYLTDPLLEQIPLLADLKRYLHHITLADPPLPTTPLIMEQVPVVYDQLLNEWKGKWIELARKQSQYLLAPDPTTLKADATRWIDSYNFDMLERFSDGPPKCAQCGNEATKRCSRCCSEWYCGRECQVKQWKKHKSSCDLLKNALDSSKS